MPSRASKKKSKLLNEKYKNSKSETWTWNPKRQIKNSSYLNNGRLTQD